MTTSEAKALYLEVLKGENSVFTSYDDVNEKTLIISYKGRNIEKVDIYITFSTTDNQSFLITLGCFSLPSFAGRMAVGPDLCNQFNRNELTKYYIDDDGDLISYAALSFNSYGVSNGFNPKQITSTAAIMAMSVDYVYPMIQNALS